MHLNLVSLIQVFFWMCQLWPHLWAEVTARNDRPIIGIVAQELGDLTSVSYIAAPYVTQMEACGARVVPVLIDQTLDYYRRIIKETNGLIIPGGHLKILGSGFSKAVQNLFHFATMANDKGDYYPIYGICRGFELMTVMILKHWAKDPRPIWLTPCQAEDESLNLKFLDNPKNSRIFQNASDVILDTLQNKKVTPNYHGKCLTPKNFTESALNKYLRIVTTSNDTTGLEFVSTFESLNSSRPIYLLQWHPEKILGEFKKVKGELMNVRHTPNAVLVAQYIGNFIVGEARKNLNKFSSQKKENEALIFNCDPLYTMGPTKGEIVEMRHFTQIFTFPSQTGCLKDQERGPIFYWVAISALSVLCLVMGLALGLKIWARRKYRQIGENI